MILVVGLWFLGIESRTQLEGLHCTSKRFKFSLVHFGDSSLIPNFGILTADKNEFIDGSMHFWIILPKIGTAKCVFKLNFKRILKKNPDGSLKYLKKSWIIMPKKVEYNKNYIENSKKMLRVERGRRKGAQKEFLQGKTDFYFFKTSKRRGNHYHVLIFFWK